ncbi:hypothetical protein ROZALSC1DRAFT_28553 [Rozella allomycis CSF55]|uniref:Uncharacterized protein n=1 Tax=Rozella allomycis (strain CSF55) TaxID=988480 RepID=A0A075B462_ROZAC|nr:hypothetical protein O9G_002693 [Rozella allomycis CSF55]RKP19902.1 hypothetical protein ROZALSC1DRAFT_28553 [Rozella allomycis CSF55]|eukprot:EPZ36050.1 hypothetical protein O9G_002693 [Rozella allomycis CSF55]
MNVLSRYRIALFSQHCQLKNINRSYSWWSYLKGKKITENQNQQQVEIAEPLTVEIQDKSSPLNNIETKEENILDAKGSDQEVIQKLDSGNEGVQSDYRQVPVYNIKNVPEIFQKYTLFIKLLAEQQAKEMTQESIRKVSVCRHDPPLIFHELNHMYNKYENFEPIDPVDIIVPETEFEVISKIFDHSWKKTAIFSRVLFGLTLNEAEIQCQFQKKKAATLLKIPISVCIRKCIQKGWDPSVATISHIVTNKKHVKKSVIKRAKGRYNLIRARFCQVRIYVTKQKVLKIRHAGWDEVVPKLDKPIYNKRLEYY